MFSNCNKIFKSTIKCSFNYRLQYKKKKKKRIDFTENRCTVNCPVFFLVFYWFFPCNFLSKENFKDYFPNEKTTTIFLPETLIDV